MARNMGKYRLSRRFLRPPCKGKTFCLTVHKVCSNLVTLHAERTPCGAVGHAASCREPTQLRCISKHFGICVNIYDIARLAEVSPATVSRVLNNNTKVSPATRKRVLDVLNQHSYVPSVYAKNLAGASSKTVAVLVDDIRHINFSIIAYEVELQAAAMGYNVFLCNTSREPENQRKHLNMLAGKKVDCLVLLGAAFCNDQVYKELNANFSATPKVLYNIPYEGPESFHVYGQLEQGIVSCVDYLYSLGHRKLAFVRNDDTWITEQAVLAFQEKAEALGLPLTPHSVFQTGSGYECGMAAVNYFAEHALDYTAVLGCDDLTAMGIIKQLNMMGKTVPGDVSVIGRFNSIFAKICTPPLTTSDNRISTIAQTISEVMHCALIKRSIPKSSEVAPVLLVRESTGPPRAD